MHAIWALRYVVEARVANKRAEFLFVKCNSLPRGVVLLL